MSPIFTLNFYFLSNLELTLQGFSAPTDREQLIFECMIANLFEEYRFFPKYPERQLKIAAVLFGEFHDKIC